MQTSRGRWSESQKLHGPSGRCLGAGSKPHLPSRLEWVRGLDTLRLREGPLPGPPERRLGPERAVGLTRLLLPCV